MRPWRPLALLVAFEACSSGGGAMPVADAGTDGADAPFEAAPDVAVDAPIDAVADAAGEAGGPSWTHLGLDNDAFYALAIDPQHPATVFAASAQHGLYRTRDAGKTWQPIDAGLPAMPIAVTAITIDPTTTSNVYVGVSSSGLFRSTDGGDTWTSSPMAAVATPESIVVDPGSPANVYTVGAAEGVYASTDKGVTWTKAANTELPLGSLDLLALDAKSGTLLCGATTGVLFASSDGGAHWAPTAAGLPTDASGMIMTLVALPSGALFAETLGDGLWTSPAAGATWSLATPATADPALAFDPSNPAIVYVSASLGQGLLRSTDSGVTFLAGGPPLQPIITRVAVGPDGTVYVAAGSGQGVWSRPASPIWP